MSWWSPNGPQVQLQVDIWYMTWYIIWHYSYRAQHHSTIPTFQWGFLASFPGEVDRFQHGSAGTKGDLRSSRQTFLPGTCRSWENSRFFFWRWIFEEGSWSISRVCVRFQVVQDMRPEICFWSNPLRTCVFFLVCFFAETIALYFFCKNRSLFSCCLSGEIRDFFFFIYKVGFWDSFSANLEISGLCSNPSSFLNWMMNDQPEIGPVGVAELVSV